MYSYIVAKVVSNNKKSITVENNYVGYTLFVSEPTKFEVGKARKIYMYKHMTMSHKSTIQEEFYGFDTYEEKIFFVNSIAITGIGPKTALSFLKNDISILKNLIAARDYNGLESLIGINKKYSYLLVEHLSDFCLKNNEVGISQTIQEAISTLKALGYSKEDINYSITGVMTSDEFDKEAPTTDVVAQVIKFIAEKNEPSVN